MKALSTKTGPPICVGLLENDPLRLVGFRTVFDQLPGVQAVAMSVSQVTESDEVDVAILGDRFPQFFDTIVHLKACRPNLKIVATGTRTDDESILKAIVYGAKGYVDEAASSTDLMQAIQTVCGGSIWAPRRVLSLLIERSGEMLRQRQACSSNITSRERQVLRMLVEGRSNKEIASPLGIEVRTVKAHVAKLMRKVGARNRISLSVQAIRCSLISAQQ